MDGLTDVLEQAIVQSMDTLQRLLQLRKSLAPAPSSTIIDLTGLDAVGQANDSMNPTKLDSINLVRTPSTASVADSPIEPLRVVPSNEEEAWNLADYNLPYKYIPKTAAIEDNWAIECAVAIFRSWCMGSETARYLHKHRSDIVLDGKPYIDKHFSTSGRIRQFSVLKEHEAWPEAIGLSRAVYEAHTTRLKHKAAIVHVDRGFFAAMFGQTPDSVNAYLDELNRAVDELDFVEDAVGEASDEWEGFDN